jgi:hypothetical protein
LLIDEVDRLFSKRDTSDITAIVNSGFQRGARVPSVMQEPTRKVEYFEVFGQMLISGIDTSTARWGCRRVISSGGWRVRWRN